jgi:hypothetical protein
MESRKPEADKYTRESFTFRRMKKWQIWALIAVLVVLVVIALAAQG